MFGSNCSLQTFAIYSAVNMIIKSIRAFENWVFFAALKNWIVIFSVMKMYHLVGGHQCVMVCSGFTGSSITYQSMMS